MTWGYIIFLLTLAVDLFTDVRLFYKKKKVNHARGAALRMIGFIPAVYFLGWQSIPMLGFWYWTLFNGIYNRLIGQQWEFVGTTAKLDRLQHRAPFLKILKYIGLIASTIIYFIL